MMANFPECQEYAEVFAADDESKDAQFENANVASRSNERII